jgi:hypothetical protein
VLPQTPIQSPQLVLSHAPQQKTAVARVPCFNCGRVWHFAQQCPKPKRGKAQRVLASMAIQKKGQFRDPILRSGRVNLTTVEDITEGEEVLAGTFLLFGHPIIIMFDSGALHDYISSVCAKRAKLSLTVAKTSYMICTPGSQIVANLIAREVPLELPGHVFPTHLIVLDGQGIDIILGMSWMNLHKAILDITK